MQIKYWGVALLLISAFPTISQARDTALYLDFEKTVQAATHAGRLDGTVKFYLAGQATPAKPELRGEAITNKKTNAFNKSDEEACDWALQSALISLQDAAKKAGGNAVVSIVSFYKRTTYSDAKEYECHAGSFIAGVALKGQIASIK